MRIMVTVWIAGGLSSTAVAAPAAPEPLVAGFLPLQPYRGTMALGIGAMFMRDRVADLQAIGATSPLVDVSVGLQLHDLIAVTGSIGIAQPTDHAPISADSSVKLYRFQIDATARTPFYALGATGAGWIAGALFAGLGESGTTGNRSVDDCADCDYAQVAVHGGPYWRAGLDVAFPTGSPGGRVGFSISYQSYFSGSSLANEIMFRGSAWLF